MSKSIEEVSNQLQTDIHKGLSSEEAASRLETYGPNLLKSKKKKSIIVIFLSQLNDWLIYVLLIAVAITAAMNEFVDAIIIMMVIIINGVLGTAQEFRAGKAIEALKKMAIPRALIYRDGEVQEVLSEKLVPGDIVVLDAGRYIAADLRLVETANLQIEESALTGESVPSIKNAKNIHLQTETSLGDRDNMAYMSTLVTNGRGLGIVVATGMNTEVGSIAKILDEEKGSKTPLEIKLDGLGKTLGLIAMGICGAIFIISILQGRDIVDMFLISVSLAVASIPEGLTAIVAIVLSIGVTKMAKQNAIVKRLPAVETLGSVNIICSDKTGTLTQNKMTVVTYYTALGRKTIEHGRNNEADDDAKLLARGLVLCSDAIFENGQGMGDPTEIALLVFADDLGLDHSKVQKLSRRENEFAFDSNRKMMSVLDNFDGERRVYTKGAVGNLLAVCNTILVEGKVNPMSEEHRKAILKITEEVSDEALRTLGLAYKTVDAVIDSEEMESELCFIGLVGMIDPPRVEVKDSIALADKAGIRTVMITGDHKSTAVAIAMQLGIATHKSMAISGKEMDAMSEEELEKAIQEMRIFARVSPQHKVRIVRSLKAAGNIVSMTGDGVNDAPSLKAADIGVAMGITGTDVAKSAASIILTDDNFATIVKAIEGGRNIYNNIKKSVIFLLTCNLGEVVAMFICLVIGWQSPLIATQLLWINLVTDSLPAVALGMDTHDKDVMNQKPRDIKEGFFSNGAGWRAIEGGLLIGLVTIIAFIYGYFSHGYSPFDKSAPESVLIAARTMAFFVLIAAQLFYSISLRNPTKMIHEFGMFTDKYLIGAIFIGLGLQLILLFVVPLREAFGLTMLDKISWLVVWTLGMMPSIINEVIKSITRKDS